MDGNVTSPPPAAPASRADDARAYEAAGNRFFLLRVAATFVVLAAYQLSGASALLANGLRGWFHGWWPLVNAVYILISVLGFSAIMFPLSLYGDYELDCRYGMTHQTLEQWFLDHLRGLGLELLLMTVFFSVVYAFLHYLPGRWWLVAAGFYVLFAVVLTSLAPVLIMPLFHKFEPLNNPELAAVLTPFMRENGIEVMGLYRWGLEEKTSAANAALAGLGRTRRIILSDTLLERYTPAEILAVLAHEVGHHRHRDILRMTVAGGATALAGFYLAHRLLLALVQRLGFAHPDDIAAFPLFLLCLFVFSLLVLPAMNAYSRRREYAADAFAVARLGTADTLVSALDKLADQNLADRNPARWIEIILHSHPSIDRRIAAARRAARPAGSDPS